MTHVDLPLDDGSRLSPRQWRQAWLTIDQNSKAIAFARSAAGILTLHLAFIATLAVSQQFSTALLVLISATLLGIAVVPGARMIWISGASLFYLAMRPFRTDAWSNMLAQKADAIAISPLMLQLTGVGLFLATVVAVLWVIPRKPQSILAKRPVLSLLALWAASFAAALALPDQTLLGAVTWAFSGTFVSSIWFLCYAAVDQKSKDQTPLYGRSALMRPFWSGSATPIGKGYAYLNKFDAKDADALAVTRLKAIKLVVWALILTGLLQFMEYVARDVFAVPVLHDLIVAHTQGLEAGIGMGWASLVYNYFVDLVVIAVWGHFIVAIIRMIGFRIPRNSRNPMAARTLADFWNRYFFYFKELLVDFFFYPAFMRFFKKNSKLRIAFATFCAACLGNFLYHFARETYIFADQSFLDALLVFQSAAFYSFALALGLIVSQLNPHKPKPEHGFIRYEVLTRFNVFAFFCFLKVFDDITGDGTVFERAGFAASLFGF